MSLMVLRSFGLEGQQQSETAGKQLYKSSIKDVRRPDAAESLFGMFARTDFYLQMSHSLIFFARSHHAVYIVMVGMVGMVGVACRGAGCCRSLTCYARDAFVTTQDLRC